MRFTSLKVFKTYYNTDNTFHLSENWMKFLYSTQDKQVYFWYASGMKTETSGTAQNDKVT